MKISKPFSRFIFPFFLFLLISCSELWGEVGDNNPTGPAGAFNGNVTTGCSYDPYTANATRTVTDIVVAGAVGQYGLRYSRTWNTRSQQGWRNMYDWSIEVSEELGQTPTYSVSFPDGRNEVFAYTASDIDYRAALGVRERLEPWTAINGNYGVCYLVMADGGKVEFYGTRVLVHDPDPPYWWYEYEVVARAMIDPYGQKTTFSYLGDSSFQITEPAGRWIRIFPPVSGVQVLRASDGREVRYTYETRPVPGGTRPYTLLTSVAYYGDPSLTATYNYRSPNVGDVDGTPLLATCDDPLYPGPMKKILYTYAVGPNPDGTEAVYAQLYSEASYPYGDAVSRLSITGTDTRMETRADGRQRTFTYAGGYLTGWTDFKNISGSQTYDSALYVDSVTDGNGHTTNFTNNPFTGAVTQIQYPATPDDTTPPTSARGTVIYTYTDANNPYYLRSVRDEAGNVTQFTRDPNTRRVTRIDYPDGAYETFAYDPTFGQMLSHRMKTGGSETFTYDGTRRLETYRNPDNASGNPTARYQYDALDRVSRITDVFGIDSNDVNHSTDLEYNPRGQVTVTRLPTDPSDAARHTIVNTYNPADGTLVSVTDQLGHTITHTYDEYRRRRSVTTPAHLGDTTPRATWFSYAASHDNREDYTHTDSNVTLLILPSTNIIKTTYDENYRKIFLTASAESGTDTATASYEYDDAGNVTSIRLPDEQSGQANADKSTISVYDERNRLMSVTDPLNHLTTVTYDAGGRKKMLTEPNGQLTTYDSYDPMNRLCQQTVKQTPEPDAVTRYTYDPTGLHMTMQDPRLVALNSPHRYTYEYDLMGRAKSLTYPPALDGGVTASESFSYDIAGRIQSYTTRSGQVQTFSYDALDRQTGFSWVPKGTSSVAYGYDAANRVTSITNSMAAISRTYFDDNLLATESETPTGLRAASTITYAYNADGNRDSIVYPSGRSYRYNYTGRDQLSQVQDNNPPYFYQAEYVYDVNGNMSTRRVGTYPEAVTDASQRNALGRVMHLEHRFTDTPRTFDYQYDPMSNRAWAQQDGGPADTYGYDQAQQLTSTVLSGTPTTFGYDANGNRTSVGRTIGGIYTSNNLNQYNSFNGLGVTYDANGNLSSYNGWTYLYDAQNRLTTVKQWGTTVATYWYDGLNRQIRQTLNGDSPTFNVWDGWSLIEERGIGNTLRDAYLYGAGEILENLTTGRFYFQDGSGNTSHLSDASGYLLEKYTYSGFGQPSFYDAAGQQSAGSAYGVRHLFQGQLWTQRTGLTDHRHRTALPAMGVFMQPDPIGFAGDSSNLYRYCGNNAVNRSDPSGLLLEGEVGIPIFYPGRPIPFNFIAGIRAFFQSKAGRTISTYNGTYLKAEDQFFKIDFPAAKDGVLAGIAQYVKDHPSGEFCFNLVHEFEGGSGAAPAWYESGYRPPAGIQAAINRGDYSTAYGQSRSSQENAKLMDFLSYGGNPNRPRADVPSEFYSGVYRMDEFGGYEQVSGGRPHADPNLIRPPLDMRQGVPSIQKVIEANAWIRAHN